MKIKAANGVARILKAEGIPWVSCYPTNHVNNALGEEGVPILMMGEERFAVAVADAFSRVTCGKQIGVCTVMANLNAAGHPDGVWRHRARPGRIPRRSWSSRKAWGRAPAGTRTTTWPRRSSRSPSGWARSIAPSWCPTTCAAPSRICAPAGRVRCCSSSRATSASTTRTSIPYAPVKGWRSGPDPGRRARPPSQALLAAKDPLLYVGEGVLLRGRHGRAPAVRRAGAGAGADDAQGARARSPRTIRCRWACAARSPTTS